MWHAVIYCTGLLLHVQQPPTPSDASTCHDVLLLISMQTADFSLSRDLSKIIYVLRLQENPC